MTESRTIEVGVAVDTEELDEALDKTSELGELMNDLAPQVSIRNCRGCTFNIYPSRMWIREGVTEHDDD